MNAAATTEKCQETGTKTAKSPEAPADKAALPVIPLMSREEGERLISQMPQRSSAEALAMMEKVLGRRMPLVEDETRK
jgi:hypothetical protein